MTDSIDAQALRSRPTRWPAIAAGLVVLAAAIAAAAVLAVPGRIDMRSAEGTLYDHSRWLLVCLLAAVGVATILRTPPAVARAVAVFGAVTAAQLATTGVVAAKHWRPLSGMTGYGSANLTTLIQLAWLLVAAGVVATAACVAAARSAGARPAPNRYRLLAVVAGLLIAALLPLVLGFGNGFAVGNRALAAYALLYSLPWGAAIAACGWLDRPATLGALAAVAVGAAAATVSHAVLFVRHPALGFVPTAMLATVLAVAVAVASGRVRAATPSA
jgi:hypothetical protein